MASESKNSRKPLVGIVMGSDTDLPVMSETAKMLEKFEVPYEIEVTSAHRSPARTHEYASTAVSRGLKVVIVAAGGAAHLAGVVAAVTTLPVVAVPMATTVLSGIDSLLSSVQMPGGRARGGHGHRQARRHQRGDFRGGNSGHVRYGNRQAAHDVQGRARQIGGRKKRAREIAVRRKNQLVGVSHKIDKI